MEEIIFQGHIRVYLQGRNALLPISNNLDTNEHITYYIGDKSTNFVIRDHRSENVAEARQIFLSQHQNGFAKNFNEHAKAEIRYDYNSQYMKIDLYEAEMQPTGCPMLWMGILENNIMPGYQVEWEVFKPVDENNTAFVAFISPAT